MRTADLGWDSNVIRKYNSFCLDGEIECFFLCVLLPLEKAKELTVKVKDSAHSLTESDAGCSLGIRDGEFSVYYAEFSS